MQYAVCGHKFRPARQVYSGFQNKIKTICIFDTSLSVSCFSWNRNGNVFTNRLPRNFPNKLTFSTRISYSRLLRPVHTDDHGKLYWYNYFRDHSDHMILTLAIRKQHVIPHHTETARLLQSVYVSTWSQFITENSRQRIGYFIQSTKLSLLNCFENLCASVHMSRKAKFILSDVDKNSHQ